MSTEALNKKMEVKSFPHPPNEFNPLTATDKELLLHGIPKRPDASASPKILKLWDETFLKKFTQITPDISSKANQTITPYKVNTPTTNICGFTASNVTVNGKQAITAADPAVVALATWNIPNPISSSVRAKTDQFHQFGYYSYAALYITTPNTQFSVGTVHNLLLGTNKAETYVYLTHDTGGNMYKINNFPVFPGDSISCKLCLSGTTNMIVSIYNYSELCYASFIVPITMGATNSGSYSAQWIVQRPLLILPNPNNPTQPFYSYSDLANFSNIYFDNAQAITQKGLTVPIGSADTTNMLDYNGTTVVAATTIEAPLLGKVAFTGSEYAANIGESWPTGFSQV